MAISYDSLTANYSTIMSGYLSDRSLYSTVTLVGEGKSGNRQAAARKPRIPRTAAVTIAVREFVREERSNIRRVTPRQVLDFLVEKQFLHISTNPKTGVYARNDFWIAYRCVRRYLEDRGYRLGRRNNIAPDPNLTCKRHIYVEAISTNRALPKEERRRDVYVDECYIHEHYNEDTDSLYDPDDNLDVQYGEAKHEGRRCCFAAAIQGPDPRVDTPKIAPEKAGLVPGSVWAFCPPKNAVREGCYVKAFNGDNFAAWFKTQLLPNLHQPSLIHMDNAAYHKSYGSHVPKWRKMPKQECLDFLESKGVPADHSRGSRVLLVALVEKWVVANEKFECVRLAEAEGHMLLFTPPFHSDLQAIEHAWTRIKRNVGRQYSDASTLELVHQRLLHEFQVLDESGHDAVQGMIVQSAGIAEQFSADIPAEDEAEETLVDVEEGDFVEESAGEEDGVSDSEPEDDTVYRKDQADLLYNVAAT